MQNYGIVHQQGARRPYAEQAGRNIHRIRPPGRPDRLCLHDGFRHVGQADGALIIVPASPRYSAGLKMLCFRGLCRFVAGRDGSFM